MTCVGVNLLMFLVRSLPLQFPLYRCLVQWSLEIECAPFERTARRHVCLHPSCVMYYVSALYPLHLQFVSCVTPSQWNPFICNADQWWIGMCSSLLSLNLMPLLSCGVARRYLLIRKRHENLRHFPPSCSTVYGMNCLNVCVYESNCLCTRRPLLWLCWLVALQLSMHQ
jgi:hypothetical protein